MVQLRNCTGPCHSAVDSGLPLFVTSVNMHSSTHPFLLPYIVSRSAVFVLGSLAAPPHAAQLITTLAAY